MGAARGGPLTGRPACFMLQACAMMMPCVLLALVAAASEMPLWMLPGGSDAKLRLIMYEDGSTEPRTWAQVEDLVSQSVRFMDVTDTGEMHAALRPRAGLGVAVPGRLSKERDALVRMLAGKVDPAGMRAFLDDFTAFHTRYFRHQAGVEAADFLQRLLEQIAEGSPMKVTVERVLHADWPQPSLIARVQNPATPDVTDDAERVVISAHLDSTALFLPMLLAAPGADDDGSGCATVLEAFRLLAGHTLDLGRPVEFMFYSAEEAGLLGSQAIVQDYIRRSVPAAVLHIDMDGSSGRADGRQPVIGLIRDNTSPVLSEFMAVLARRYTKLAVADTECGYACSDHASWTAGGYASAALCESRFEDTSKAIHTPMDTVDKLDFAHMGEFVKVALAYALHMSEPAE